MLLPHLLCYVALYEYRPLVRATGGVVAVKFWDFSVPLAGGGGGGYEAAGVNRPSLGPTTHCQVHPAVGSSTAGGWEFNRRQLGVQPPAVGRLPPRQKAVSRAHALPPQSFVATDFKEELLSPLVSDDFQFVAPVVGPIGKDEFVRALRGFDVRCEAAEGEEGRAAAGQRCWGGRARAQRRRGEGGGGGRGKIWSGSPPTPPMSLLLLGAAMHPSIPSFRA